MILRKVARNLIVATAVSTPVIALGATSFMFRMPAPGVKEPPKCTAGEHVFNTPGQLSWSFPANVISHCASVTIKVWGAGGGGSWAQFVGGVPGGGGGFAEASFDPSALTQTLVINIGGGGYPSHRPSDPGAGGVVGGGNGGDNRGAGSADGAGGGGLSAVRMDSGTWVVAAGSGGGAAAKYSGGPGGGLIGGAPAAANASAAATGGTQTSGGAHGTMHAELFAFDAANGSRGQGGNGGIFRGGHTYANYAGGGGGAGYFGGGGGASFAGGAGGSGYIMAGANTSQLLAGSGHTPAATSDPDYITGIGVGSDTSQAGGHGLIVIRWAPK